MDRYIPLSAFDHMFTRNMAGPIQLIYHFPSALPVERIVDAFRATVQDFRPVGARLARLDDHTFAYDVGADVAQIRVTSDASDTPVNTCIDPVNLEIGEPLSRVRIAQLGRAGTAIGVSMSHAVMATATSCSSRPGQRGPAARIFRQLTAIARS